MQVAMPIPESARVLVLQEKKFKRMFSHLVHLLNDYDEIVGKVIPVTAMLLRPCFQDLEFHLRPGMTTLTWTSMNIDKFIDNLDGKVERLGTLVRTVNEIISTRIERHLRLISQTVLVDIPGKAVSMKQFVDMQAEYIAGPSASLAEKNVEVERAVQDLISTVTAYPLHPSVVRINGDDVTRLQQVWGVVSVLPLLHIHHIARFDSAQL